MTQITIELNDDELKVLSTRARQAGLPVEQQLRAEVKALFEDRRPRRMIEEVIRENRERLERLA